MNNKDLGSKTDAELVLMAQGDPEYFGSLVFRYQEKLFYYIKRITYFSNEDIEDIVQEVFVKVYRNINSYDERIKFSSWIYRIAHNHMIDQIRKSEARPKTTSIDQTELIHFMKSSVDIEEEVISRDCLNKAKGVMEKLPFKYREALTLRFLEEKGYEEIMDILSKPKGTVATLIKRGRELLVDEMNKQNINCR